MEQLKTLFAPSIESWAGAWDTLRAKAAQVWPEIKNGALGLWREGLLPLGEYLMSTFVPDVVNAFSGPSRPSWGTCSPAICRSSRMALSGGVR